MPMAERSRPTVGSSSSQSSAGAATSRASDNRRRWPDDRNWAGVFASAPSPTVSSASSIRPGPPLSQAQKERFSRTVITGLMASW